MKKVIWIIITLLLSGLIPAGVAIMLKYNDLCSVANKAYFEKNFIQSIESASQASDLIPFLPQADREIQRSLSALTDNDIAENAIIAVINSFFIISSVC